MKNREELLAYAMEKYGVSPEYPWARTPKSAVLRHRHNRKWFGAIVEVARDKLGLAGEERVDALLLKCDPVMIGSLRSQPGILPGYHMNKEHWISIVLDGSVPGEQARNLVDLSYDLTR